MVNLSLGQVMVEALRGLVSPQVGLVTCQEGYLNRTFQGLFKVVLCTNLQFTVAMVSHKSI